jgi:hypothetical protein
MKIPTWILVTVGLIASLALFAGLSLVISPATFIPNLDVTSPVQSNLVLMWAMRQIAIALTMFFVLYTRKPHMLFTALFSYGLMTGLDMIVGVVEHDTALALGSGFFCALATTLLYKLYPITK